VTGPSGAKVTNKVRFTGATLKTANGFSRSSVFSGRDVQVGDVIEVTDNLGNVSHSRIKALSAETADIDSNLAAVIAPVVVSGSDGLTASPNFTTFSSSSATFNATKVIGQYITITGVGVRRILACPSIHTLTLDAPIAAATGLTFRIGGTHNDVNNKPIQTVDFDNAPAYVSGSGSNTNVVVANAATAYTGYAAKGILSDIYTVTVTAGSNLSTVRFSIASTNGAFVLKEDVALEAGDLLIIDEDNNNSVALDFTGSTAFVLGSSWTLGVTAGVAQVNPTTSGSYAGPRDMVYRLFVERGGAFFNGTNADTCARVAITSSDVDSSSLVLPEAATNFAVGSYGVVAQFASGSNNGGLIAGDSYYIPVAAASKGKVTIVELVEDLAVNTVALSTSRTAKLFLSQPSISIPESRDLLADTYNWVQTGSYITINAGISTSDSKLTATGVPVLLPVRNARLFVEHRDLLQDNVVAISTIRSAGDVVSRLGVIAAGNPLAQGVNEALLNATGQKVYYLGVATDDLAGYTAALKIAEKSNKVYSLVPLTFDVAVRDAFVAHVNAMSTPESARWRIAWLSVQDEPTRLVYDLQDNGDSWLATVTDDPSVTGTQNRLVTVEGATFLDDGVRPNDSIRLNFRLNANGTVGYDDYIVDSVRTNTTLVLVRTLAAAITVPTKVQVVRHYTRSERAANIAAIGGSYNNRRVRCVFPDSGTYAGVTKAGYIFAAGLAGLRSGVVPHQGLTNTEYLGVDELSKVVNEFSQDDLDVMAAAGIWILTQEVLGATPYVRHQLTTDTSGLNTSEDSITTNVDSISYGYQATLDEFIGRYNVNTDNLAIFRAAIVAKGTYYATETRVERAGNQLNSFNPKEHILSFGISAAFKDRVSARVRLDLPGPLNYFDLTLVG